MRSIEGLVIIVQEGRFQLVDDAGVAHLFLLGHAASADPEQLAPLQRKQARVRVMYRPAERLIAHVAKRLVLLDR
jgi:hypothetical protein